MQFEWRVVAPEQYCPRWRNRSNRHNDRCCKRRALPAEAKLLPLIDSPLVNMYISRIHGDRMPGNQVVGR